MASGGQPHKYRNHYNADQITQDSATQVGWNATFRLVGIPRIGAVTTRAQPKESVGALSVIMTQNLPEARNPTGRRRLLGPTHAETMAAMNLRGGSHGGPVAPDRFASAVGGRGWNSQHRFVIQITAHIGCKRRCRIVPPSASPAARHREESRRRRQYE